MVKSSLRTIKNLPTFSRFLIIAISSEALIEVDKFGSLVDLS